VEVTHDFINKLAANLFASQQEILFQLRTLKRDFETVSEKAGRAAEKAEEAARATREMATGFQALTQTMSGLVDSQDGQASQLSQLIQALGGLLNSNVTNEIWRQQADQRLSRIEDWIDKRDEAS
jgi:DNA repair ATPase RecN